MAQVSAKVLIVDDDPVNLTILEDLLRSAGYDIITAATGTEALEVFVMADPPVQLVLLDVTLPDMSGHEVWNNVWNCVASHVHKFRVLGRGKTLHLALRMPIL